MRRSLRAVPVLALAFVVAALLATPASAQLARKPDLVVSSAAEPPDFIATEDGGDFLLSFTVDNQGRRKARKLTLARAYLSIGRVMSRDDRRRRVGQRRVKPLKVGNSITRRLVVRIPETFRAGEYFLIVCADVRNVVDEINDRANCHVSGQRIRIERQAPSNIGPPGPEGPPGPQGPPGPGADVVQFGRTVMNMGFATKDSVNFSGMNSGIDPNGDEENDEGSTQITELAKIGPISIRALCRQELPFEEEGDNDAGDEAKILVYHDGPEGSTMAFRGTVGPRGNLPPGEGTPGEEGSDGGEGQHQILATFRDPDEGFGPAHDGSNREPQTFEPPQDGNQDDQTDPGAQGSYTNTGAFVSHSEGWDIAITAFAGIDVLNIAPLGDDSVDKCVFGGYATVVRRP